ISVSALLGASSMSAIANEAYANNAASPLMPELTARPSSAAPFPMSPAQQHIWVHEHLGIQGNTYNIPLAFHMTGALSPEALTAAIDDVVGRHEALRTRVDEADLQVRQI